MTQSSSHQDLAQLKKCLALAQDVEKHQEAKQLFEQLYEKLAEENPQAASLLDTIWQELIAARRSETFWHKISDFEKDMADQMFQNLTQSRQNYLRLMQEM
ncbi:hypothetical protein [Oscillatoria salina]|uniref:hypothetical protein n=1 Tax=Oscillatoria salina TaxID=331517 RepID=UPI0013B6611F|nr:hypothetical protein [Oscillatoria salina]MBZ8179821.1 hypothetical protein [Oscillatoria salina IIICB1]NET88108.1 hypothetical protein [Kamptonema sp. SIO1D9]